MVPGPVRSIALLIVLLLCGCAGLRTPLKEEDRTALRNSCVDPQVSMPADVYYVGPAESVGGILGIAGGLTGEALEQSDRAALRALFSEHRIDVGALLAERLGFHLVRSGLPAGQPGSGCDASFRITVERYGLMARNFQQPVPVVWASISLRRQDGTLLWEVLVKQPGEFELDSAIAPVALEDYRKDPQALRRAFTSALDIVARKSVAALQP